MTCEHPMSAKDSGADSTVRSAPPKKRTAAQPLRQSAVDEAPEPPLSGADNAEQDFIDALASFTAAATRIAQLGRRRIVKGLAASDQGSGESMTKMLSLMGDIELSFERIRQKLLQ
jgi:hypothetical protein